MSNIHFSYWVLFVEPWNSEELGAVIPCTHTKLVFRQHKRFIPVTRKGKLVYFLRLFSPLEDPKLATILHYRDKHAFPGVTRFSCSLHLDCLLKQFIQDASRQHIPSAAKSSLLLFSILLSCPPFAPK